MENNKKDLRMFWVEKPLEEIKAYQEYLEKEVKDEKAIIAVKGVNLSKLDVSHKFYSKKVDRIMCDVAYHLCNVEDFEAELAIIDEVIGDLTGA